MNKKFVCCLMILSGFLLSVESVYAQDIIEKPEEPVKPVHVSSGNAKLQQLERQYQQDYRKSVNLFNNGEIQEALQAFRNMKTRKYYANHKSEINSWITKCEAERDKREKAEAERKMLAETELRKGLEQVDSLIDLFQYEKAKKHLDKLKNLPIQNSEVQAKEKLLQELISKKNLADNRIRRMAEGLKRLNPQDMDIFSPIYTAVKIDNKWGFADSTFQIVIACQYDGARSFQGNGLAAVCKEGKWGIIDKTGKIIAPFKYNEAPYFKEGRAIGWKTDRKHLGVFASGSHSALSIQYTPRGCYIDEKGQEVTKVFDNPKPFSNGFALVGKYRKMYFIDKNGVQASPTYQYATSFSDGLAFVDSKDSDSPNKYYVNNKWEKIVEMPNSLSHVGYTNNENFSEGFLRVTPINYKYSTVCPVGYMDKHGKLLIPCKYYRAEDFNDGYAKVQTLEQYNATISSRQKGRANKVEYTYIDKNGYEFAFPQCGHLFVFSYKKNNKSVLGLKNAKGDVIVEPVFSKIGAITFLSEDILKHSWDCGLLIVCKNNQFGLINEFGTSTFDFE